MCIHSAAAAITAGHSRAWPAAGSCETESMYENGTSTEGTRTYSSVARGLQSLAMFLAAQGFPCRAYEPVSASRTHFSLSMLHESFGMQVSLREQSSRGGAQAYLLLLPCDLLYHKSMHCHSKYVIHNVILPPESTGAPPGKNMSAAQGICFGIGILCQLHLQCTMIAG